MEPADVLSSYHELTKHTPVSIRSGGHRLDWSNKPVPYKMYRGLEAMEPPPDVGRLCRLSNGILRWRDLPDGERHGFRAAACTGALYHIELYLATAAREDLPAGLYHYGAHDHRLRRLREGDLRGALVEATGVSDTVATAPLVVILTSTFWRNAWKYGARAYRHAFWDAGAILANLLALLAQDDVPASVLVGFADEDVSNLLGIDGVREAAVAIVAVGAGASPPATVGPLPPLHLTTEPLSAHEVRYREIEEAHRASSLDRDGVAAWRSKVGPASRAVPPALTDPAIEGIIERRRSSRRFGSEPIGLPELEAVVSACTATVPGEALASNLIEPHLIVNEVEGLEPGAYRGDLSPIRDGDFRSQAGRLALGQGLGADAAVDIFFLTDLAAAFGRLGGRGYRLAQLAGGIALGRAELAATALGLGATGMTFFDDEVTRFFEPAAEGRAVMSVAALGQRA